MTRVLISRRAPLRLRHEARVLRARPDEQLAAVLRGELRDVVDRLAVELGELARGVGKVTTVAAATAFSTAMPALGPRRRRGARPRRAGRSFTMAVGDFTTMTKTALSLAARRPPSRPAGFGGRRRRRLRLGRAAARAGRAARRGASSRRSQVSSRSDRARSCRSSASIRSPFATRRASSAASWRFRAPSACLRTSSCCARARHGVDRRGEAARLLPLRVLARGGVALAPLRGVERRAVAPLLRGEVPLLRGELRLERLEVALLLRRRAPRTRSAARARRAAARARRARARARRGGGPRPGRPSRARRAGPRSRGRGARGPSASASCSRSCASARSSRVGAAARSAGAAAPGVAGGPRRRERRQSTAPCRSERGSIPGGSANRSFSRKCGRSSRNASRGGRDLRRGRGRRPRGRRGRRAAARRAPNPNPRLTRNPPSSGR